MIELPGSFAGRSSSPSPVRGPDPSRRMSFAILVSATASVLSAPEKKTSPSFDASASNLFGAGSKDRKSTRLNSVTHAHLVCRLLLENTKNTHTTSSITYDRRIHLNT